MNKENESGFNEEPIFGPSKDNPPNMSMFDKRYDLKGPEFINPLPSTYSIPIYENGIKTEWTVDGVIGDEKYHELIKLGNGYDLPVLINTKTTRK